MICGLLFIFVFEFINVETLLVYPRKSCVPTQAVTGPCHTCICTEAGVYHCESTKCQSRVLASVTPNYEEIPQIKEGQPCTVGKVYKVDCNTCQCASNNALLCTKMACLQNMDGEKIKNKAQDKSNLEQKRRSFPKKTPSKTSKKIVKSFPHVPEGPCVPGKLYSKGCKKCLCSDQKEIVCTKLCKSSVPYRLNDHEISQLESRSAQDLQELPHMGKECIPGKAYKVSCNLCLCNEKGGLVCTAKLCLNFTSFTENQAQKLTGTSCKKDYNDACVKCKCMNFIYQCTPTKTCDVSAGGKQLLSFGKRVKLSLDATKDKCVPNVTYKVHCNTCYCQADGTLRCTQKVCLTHSQAKDLNERQSYLEKHGY